MIEAFLVCVLAAHRATRAVTVDAITDGPRKRLERWAYRQRRREPVVDWRVFIHSLMVCPDCVGFWLSGVTVGVVWQIADHHLAGWWFPIVWWAVAGGQSILASLQGRLDD